MTKLAVPIMVRKLDQALAAAAEAEAQGADLVEFRVDRFAGPPQHLATLVERSCLPCIITCRPTWEGGGCSASTEDRLDMLEHATAGQHRPVFIDFELRAYQESAEHRRRIAVMTDRTGAATGLILSSHDFEGRPTDLSRRIEAMATSDACDAIKVVWQARSLRDNIEAFEILVDAPKPTIALCMGAEGTPSRVLAKKFGALLSFAAADAGSATADGQPTVDTLKKLYRWDALRPDTRVYGVIGHPVGHSASPAIHNAAFDATGHNGVYLPMPVRPGYESFKATMATWLDFAPLHFHGASVTLPHKENLLRFVRSQGGQIEPLAEKIGAANTVVRREDGSLYASNTDYAAALDAVTSAAGIDRSQLADQRVVVIGAGGVARAIVAAFADCGARIAIYNRTQQNAQKLADDFNTPTSPVVAAAFEALPQAQGRIIVNCTPLGMSPNVDTTPIPDGAMRCWDHNTIVFDTIYNPSETRLLKEARAAGCSTVGGTEMFVRQAAGQFELWTGRPAPLELFRRVLANKS